MASELIQYVYWYPPTSYNSYDNIIVSPIISSYNALSQPIMNPNNITTINTDGYTGMLIVSLNMGLLFNNNDLAIMNLNDTVNIILTPEAYTNWYNNVPSASNITFLRELYQSLISPSVLLGVTYSNANESVSAYLSEQGFYWNDYNTYTQYTNVSSVAVNPSIYYFDTTNCHLLLRDISTATTSGIVSTSTIVSSITSSIVSAITQSSTIISSQTTSNISTVVSTVSNIVSSLTSSINTTINSIETDTLLIGLGALGLIGAYLMIEK